jgi:hypothetical protein
MPVGTEERRVGVIAQVFDATAASSSEAADVYALRGVISPTSARRDATLVWQNALARAANIHARGEMGVFDKVKAAAGQATTKAQENVATMQTKRKLTQAYGELGQTTYELVQSGELTHPRLSPTAERISAVKARLEPEQREEGPPPSAPSAPGTPPESPTVPPL